MIYQGCSTFFKEKLGIMSNEQLLDRIISNCTENKTDIVFLTEDQINVDYGIITEIDSITKEVCIISKDKLDIFTEIHEGSPIYFASSFEGIEGVRTKIIDLPIKTLQSIVEMLELNIF